MLCNLILFLFISGSLFYIFYKWATVNKIYFSKRRIKHFELRLLIGNTLGLFLWRYTPPEFFDFIYYRFPKEKLIGFFDGRTPAYFARDLDFIRQITIKDFDNFEDHITFFDNSSDSMFGNCLLFLSENKWRDMRATLSPAFTGSKMRRMFELVVECADDMAKYLVEESKHGKPIRWEMKELFTRYTSDVIATCAFGLKVNSLTHSSNEFFVIGTKYLKSAFLRLFLILTLPRLTRAINFEFFPAHVKQFFKSIVLNTMKEREQKKIFRPDMINILMQVRSGDLKHHPEEVSNDDAGFATVEESHIGKVQVKQTWTDDEIVAQCFIFFAAGFDTTSTAMSLLSYELAFNQEVQQKIYEEIREVNANLNGARLSYDTLSKLKYLDQVISETLRKWPPIVFTGRKCTKDYECDLHGNKFMIERGKSIWIPIYSIHHDPELYENPEKFDPERFNDENKHKIKAGSYVPFGIGPRNCIGSRFALMEVKALLFYLLLNFNIQPYEKTEIPIKISFGGSFSLNVSGRIDLEFQARELI